MKPQRQMAKNSPAGSILAIERLDATPLSTAPYEYMIVENFIREARMEAIIADYPFIKKGGSFPLSSVEYGGNFAALIEELKGEDFRRAVERKFALSLEGRPTMFTVRGRCRAGRDGKIHTDTESKIITVLLYMNHAWENQGGKLRVLNSENIEDFAAEVPPVAGSLLIFRRSDRSFHGHKDFTGERKVIQMNWVTEQKYIDQEQSRHSRSSWWKGLFSKEY